MTTKVYLVHLSGQGDNHFKLLDKEGWDWLFTNEPMSEAMVAAYCRPGHAKEEALREELTQMNFGVLPEQTSYKDNERAMMVPASIINGLQYDDYGGSFKDLKGFLKQNDLEIEEEYEGYIW